MSESSYRLLTYALVGTGRTVSPNNPADLLLSIAGTHARRPSRPYSFPVRTRTWGTNASDSGITPHPGVPPIVVRKARLGDASRTTMGDPQEGPIDRESSWMGPREDPTDCGGPVTRSATVTPRSMESPRAWDPQEGPASGRVLKSIGTPKTRCANPDSASVEDPMAMLFRLEAPVAAMQVLHDQQ